MYSAYPTLLCPPIAFPIIPLSSSPITCQILTKPARNDPSPPPLLVPPGTLLPLPAERLRDLITISLRLYETLFLTSHQSNRET